LTDVYKSFYLTQLSSIRLFLGDTVINIREVIMMFRVRYSLHGKPWALEKAVGALERYFFLITIAAYLNLQVSGVPSSACFTPSTPQPLPPFSSWLCGRNELCTMIDLLKKSGYRLDLFRPIDDLTFLSDTAPTTNYGSFHHRGGLIGESNYSRITNELEKYIIKV
jgi:hypothetical protein